MAGTLNEKDLEHLDKQTLITLLVSTNASNAALLKQVEQLEPQEEDGPHKVRLYELLPLIKENAEVIAASVLNQSYAAMASLRK